MTTGCEYPPWHIYTHCPPSCPSLRAIILLGVHSGGAPAHEVFHIPFAHSQRKPRRSPVPITLFTEADMCLPSKRHSPFVSFLRKPRQRGSGSATRQARFTARPRL